MILNNDCYCCITGLLAENTRLLEEKRELEKQFSRDREQLETRARDVLMQMEDMTEAHEKQQDGNKVKHGILSPSSRFYYWNFRPFSP